MLILSTRSIRYEQAERSNAYRIYVDSMRGGKIVANLGCLRENLLFASSFIQQMGRLWGKGSGWGLSLFQPAVSFTVRTKESGVTSK